MAIIRGLGQLWARAGGSPWMPVSAGSIRIELGAGEYVITPAALTSLHQVTVSASGTFTGTFTAYTVDDSWAARPDQDGWLPRINWERT
jgi:hypothetical protein